MSTLVALAMVAALGVRLETDAYAINEVGTPLPPNSAGTLAGWSAARPASSGWVHTARVALTSVVSRDSPRSRRTSAT
ncbi:hypothetical protein [Natronomonas sp. EA1]|uniref:hypothetical protein n=1 Tax=Natronomonas sp. EA1 TaxID=3421655 RepID=UPI003EC0D3CB